MHPVQGRGEAGDLERPRGLIGNPSMTTCGLPDSAKDDWNWLAIWFSVYALAARSPTTRTTMMTIKVIIGHLLRRRRIRGGGPWYP
jgi:hypothetical protein